MHSMIYAYHAIRKAKKNIGSLVKEFNGRPLRKAERCRHPLFAESATYSKNLNNPSNEFLYSKFFKFASKNDGMCFYLE